VSLYLDGSCLADGMHEVELSLSYALEMTLRLGKALLVDAKCDSKRIIRNLEETMFYKLPELEKCILSD